MQSSASSSSSHSSTMSNSHNLNIWDGYYKNVCLDRPVDYHTYTHLDIPWGNQDDYEVIHKLGRGKYSEVFEGVNLKNNQKCVVKILKPVRTEKIYREIKILQTLYVGPNIVRLYDVIRDTDSKIPSLVYEYIPNIESKILFQRLNDHEIRFYLYRLLEALEYSHSHGIMHRDLKPLNIVINHEKKDLRLIDWGLADFYKPNQEYNVRVASRYYKGPELLVDDKLYHYSLDMWSLGCTMAGMMLRVDTFFKGSDNEDQLVKIAQVMGTDDLVEYLKKYKLSLPSKLTNKMKRYPQRDLEEFINRNNQGLCSEEGFELLSSMLKYDKNLRITPTEAMRHPYFDPVRQMLINFK